MADLTAGFLLATGVLAALVRARESSVGELVEVSLLAAAMAVQLQDLVWLPGEADGRHVRVAGRADLEFRAAEIAGGVGMNPYYRCFETADGFLAVACLNLAQRSAFLELFGLDDATLGAPDLVPDDPTVFAAKEALTAEIERAIAGAPTRSGSGGSRPRAFRAGPSRHVKESMPTPKWWPRASSATWNSPVSATFVCSPRSFDSGARLPPRRPPRRSVPTPTKFSGS
jgi:crotonobetainyl-CoA:carnitine CoA-transferase CaiB-like acyl-CoA transferase